MTAVSRLASSAMKDIYSTNLQQNIGDLNLNYRQYIGSAHAWRSMQKYHLHLMEVEPANVLPCISHLQWSVVVEKYVIHIHRKPTKGINTHGTIGDTTYTRKREENKSPNSMIQ